MNAKPKLKWSRMNCSYSTHGAKCRIRCYIPLGTFLFTDNFHIIIALPSNDLQIGWKGQNKVEEAIFQKETNIIVHGTFHLGKLTMP